MFIAAIYNHILKSRYTTGVGPTPAIKRKALDAMVCRWILHDRPVW